LISFLKKRKYMCQADRKVCSQCEFKYKSKAYDERLSI